MMGGVSPDQPSATEVGAERPIGLEPDADDERADDRAGTDAAELPQPDRTPPRRRRVDRALLAASFVAAIGLTLMIYGATLGITGDDRADLPRLVERVDPVPEAVQVLSQSSVFVDLEAGYTGVLVIDGVEIETVAVDELGSLVPGQQVDLPPVTIYEPGNATLTFTPTADAVITGFESGLHRAQVLYWPIDQDRQRARSFTWTFTVV